MPKEYIEREGAIAFVKRNTPCYGDETSMNCVERSLKNVPAADVVELNDCEKCKHFGKHATQYPCSHCKNCYTDKFDPKYKKPTTNFDRIKAMNVEELAAFLDDMQTDALFLEGTIHDLKYPTDWKQYLESEVEGE